MLSLRPLLIPVVAISLTIALFDSAQADSTFKRETLLPNTIWATEVITQAADQEGPTVVLVGGIHGDEPAGAYAATQISRWPIKRGTLICIPRANVTALAAGQRRIPDLPKEMADLNRNFPHADAGVEPRGDLAAAIWRVVSEAKPAWVVDLHEGFAVHRQNPKSVGSSVIRDKSAATTEIARELLQQVNANLEEEAQFELLGPPVDSSLARAAHEHLGAQAMILETTYSASKLPVRVRQHRLMVWTLLSRLDMLTAGVTTESGLLPETSAETIRVALYNDGGVGGNGVASLTSQLGSDARFLAAQVCGDDIAAGALDQFDLLICSGGSGSAQSRSLGEKGRDNVRGFVDGGGDYIGICAGSYLACKGFSWGLGILDAKTVSSRWRRGRAVLPLSLAAESRELFGWENETANIKYHNGPIIEPLNDPAIPDFTTLASFAEEVAENGSPVGVMVNSPAIVLGDYGRGQVMCISPHPEQTEGCEKWLPRAVKRLNQLQPSAN